MEKTNCFHNYRAREERTSQLYNETLDKISAMFAYSGIGDNIDIGRMERDLQEIGHIGIMPHEGRIIYVRGSYSGKPGNNYLPPEYLVASPEYDINGKFLINKEIIVIRNTPSASPLEPFIAHHITAIADAELSLYIGEILTRCTQAIVAGTDGDAESARHYIEDVESGKLGVIMGQSLINNLHTIPLAGTTNTLTDLIEVLQYHRAALNQAIGLSSPQNLKRESITSGEAGLGEDTLHALPDIMLRSRLESIKHAQDVLGTNIEIKFTGQWERNTQEAEATEEPEEKPEATEETEEGENIDGQNAD